MKVLIIPDVHGRDFWKEPINQIDDYDKVVFLGDYLDPYPHEEISFDHAVENLQSIILYKIRYPDKIVLLLGNHDMHYYNLYFMNCSRMNRARREEIHKIYDEFRDEFELAHIIDNYLFTHAGVYQSWMDKYKLTIEDLLEFKLDLDWLEDISSYRGGWDKTGSCVWADIRESYFYKPVEGYIQIVGHTQLSDVPHTDSTIKCLDVRRPFELDTETNIIKDIENDRMYT